MLTHRGFSAWITCEGKSLPELRAEVNEDNHMVSCWIPSYEGEAFTVHWRDLGGYVDTSAYIFLDGHVVPGRFLFGYGDAERGAMRVGSDAERPFIFSKVEEDGDGNAGHNAGVIKLKIKRIKRAASRAPNVYHEPPKPKGVSGYHCVGYGEERPAPKQQKQTWTTEPYDKNEPGPYVTFVFRYRSLDTLLAQNMFVATESPVAVSDEENESDGENNEDNSHLLDPSNGMKRKASLLTPSPSPGPSLKKLKPTSRTPSYGSVLWDLPVIDTSVASSSQASNSSIPSSSNVHTPIISTPSSLHSSSQPSPNRKYYRY